ncbi:unnamed protein product [Cunninghamella blakesleeana]
MSHTKRFPIPCRFYSPGAPRPVDTPHYIVHGDNIDSIIDLEPEPIQNPNHDIEINELETLYKEYIHKKEQNDTSVCYVLYLPFGIIELLVPFHYPDIPCSIRFSKENKSFDIEKQVLDNFKYFQQQLEHVTLVQQLRYLCDSMESLLHDSNRKSSITL